MRRNRSKIKAPNIAIIIIFIISLGLGLKGFGYIINHFDKNSQSDNFRESRNGETSAYSFSGKLRPINNLSECQIITQRNLFDPLGGIRMEAKPKTEAVIMKEEKPLPPQPRPAPLNSIILTGIVYLNDEYLALIEDTSNSKSSYFKKGSKLKDCTIESITEKNITLVNENSKHTQALGSKIYYDTSGKLLIDGQINAKPSLEVARSSEEKSSPPSSNNANMSLIEQMKARRKKELGQE